MSAAAREIVVHGKYQSALRDAEERARQEGLPAAAMDRLGIAPAADGRWRSVMDLAGNDFIAWPLLMRCVSLASIACQRGRRNNFGRMRAMRAIYTGNRLRPGLSRREDGVDLALVAFDEIGGLSNEIREKLNHVTPESLGAAARIQGMTPAALASIAAFVRKREAA